MDFKVKCVRVRKYPEYFTLGKIYEVKNNTVVCDNGEKFDTWSYMINGNADFEAFRKWWSKWFDFELVEDKKVFTKSDLKTGDFVLRANGVEEVFIEHLGAFAGKNGFMPLSSVNDDLTHSGCDNGWDIVKVRRPTQVCHCQFDVPRFGDIVYDRERDTKPLYNGKVVCIDNCYNLPNYTVGKIYQFKDGVLTSDSGYKFTNDYDEPFSSFDEWCDFTSSKFIEIKE